MISIAICDEEKNFVKEVYNVLSNISKKNNIDIFIDIFENGDQFLVKFKKVENQYNIVFINIDANIFINNMTGIEVAKYIKKLNKNTQIIFFSRSKKYVFEGYNIGISNYLLKPTGTKLEEIDKKKIEEEFFKILDKLYEIKKNLFVVKSRDYLKVLNIEDILFFEAKDRKIIVVTKNGKFSFYNKMSNLENNFNKNLFIRCHRGFLINPEHIKEITSENVYLNYGYKIPISRLKISNVKSKFINYLKKNDAILSI